MTAPLLDYLNSEILAELGRRRLPQRTLAEPLGISEQQVSERLLGRVVWNVIELEIVARLLGIPIAKLLPADAQAAAS